MSGKAYFHKKARIKTTPSAKKVIKEIIIWILLIVITISASYFITTNVFVKTSVSGTSMEPTLKEGQVVIVNKLEYYIKSPKRNDVIVYKQSNKEHSYFEIKRVIGLPGETVKIKNGIVYINDEAIKEKVKTEAISNSGLAEEGVKLDDNEYFVLGDNRNDSEDSRFAGIGNVLKNEILGKAVATEKPFSLVDSLNLAD
ncbi:signal peptidase I [Catonella morbi ATCC 51271]|jgi:signal peptidase I|uniref:Signal peptidase I n=1 Tax=Catonella morbi ATCC 51271 TaxID=592026 RepID=V2Y920_9FIRM|nr:signal peptidase I [Catonella morbi]ESL04577.1 signal peptidase I [Catonella morbi ATCC 51271]